MDKICRQQITSLFSTHIDELRAFLTLPDELIITIPNNVSQKIDYLTDLCSVPVEQTSPDQFWSAYEILCDLHNLLKLLNQEIDAEFMATEIGQLLFAAYEWYQMARATHFNLSLMDVWDFIHPVQPDNLTMKSNAVYEATWWSPVPPMDIEILKRTYGVELLNAPFEPDDLPASLSVRFAIFPLPFELATVAI